MNNHPHKNIKCRKAALRCILRRSRKVSLFAAFNDYLIQYDLNIKHFNNLDDVLNEPTIQIFVL